MNISTLRNCKRVFDTALTQARLDAAAGYRSVVAVDAGYVYKFALDRYFSTVGAVLAGLGFGCFVAQMVTGFGQPLLAVQGSAVFGLLILAPLYQRLQRNLDAGLFEMFLWMHPDEMGAYKDGLDGYK